MTKANERAVAAMKSAEKRAKRKIKRLQKKGVRTGNISPLKDVDTSNTWAVKRYTKELEKFVSRETRYVAGHEGTPIPYSLWRDYQRLERKWNKEHNKYWGKFANQPFITVQGESDMTLGQMSSVVHVKGLPYGDIGYKRSLESTSVRGAKDLQKRMKILKKEISPEYREKRVKELRKNLVSFVNYFNDKELTKEIKSLTDEQLFILQDFTDFVEIFYFHYRPPELETISRLEALEQDNERNHMMMLIQTARAKSPGTRTKKKKPSRKRKK